MPEPGAESPSRRSSAVIIGALGEQRRALDRVLELADVARPVVADQQLLRVVVEAVEPLLQLAAEAADERSRQRQDVVLALAQRRRLTDTTFSR